MAKIGVKDFAAHYRAIAQIVRGPVSAEVINATYGIARKARNLVSLAPEYRRQNPAHPDGDKPRHRQKKEGIPTNCTFGVFPACKRLLLRKRALCQSFPRQAGRYRPQWHQPHQEDSGDL